MPVLQKTGPVVDRSGITFSAKTGYGWAGGLVSNEDWAAPCPERSSE